MSTAIDGSCMGFLFVGVLKTEANRLHSSVTILKILQLIPFKARASYDPEADG